MSRAIMNAQIEAEQQRGDEGLERLAKVRCQFCTARALPDDIFCGYHRRKEDEFFGTDFDALMAEAEYYDGLLQRE